VTAMAKSETDRILFARIARAASRHVSSRTVDEAAAVAELGGLALPGSKRLRRVGACPGLGSENIGLWHRAGQSAARQRS
jgi:hypothetical protein